MKIAIYGRPFEKRHFEPLQKLFSTLLKKNIELSVFKSFKEYLHTDLKFDLEADSVFSRYDELDEKTDVMISIGGDGTFLEAVSIIRNRNIPIIGINIGRLGFLASVQHNEIDEALDSILKKTYTLEPRSLLELQTKNQLFGDLNFALNEITVHKRDSSSMMTINAYMNDELINSYWADGLIISTPTGSTAYSLSAGGPIVMPMSNNFVITPLAPHSLAVRPIVMANSNIIKLKIEGRSLNYMASLDYRSEIFDSSTELIIKKADFFVQLIRLPGQSFFSTIRNKLLWGIDKRN
ncbi:MAG: NAD kinase [Bacteroidales bacterium]|nr:NAD kinase [Bacteroidales bacterium]